MQGVRFTEDWLVQHKAKMAGHKAVPAAPARVEAAPAPVSGLVSKQKVKRPEQALQIEQVEFLTWALVAPWRFLHIPNGGFRTPAEAGIMKAMGQQEGAADLLFLGPRWPFMWIENKSAVGRLSNPQKDWRDWCQSIGAPWFLCRSLDDLVAACAESGVPLRGRPA